MQNILLQIGNFKITPMFMSISLGVLLCLYGTKKYFGGAQCKLHKDLSDKVAVITGGNTGIGKQTVLQLAKMKCTIIIGARDKNKLQETIKEVIANNKQSKAIYHELDLSDKQSIRNFAQFVKANVNKIDYLINNAGVMALPQRKQTKDGFQMQMGTNHLGHFYLSHLLFSLIKKSQHPRIVNVSSRAHRRTKGINFEDFHSIQNYNPFVVYGNSKLANIYFTKILQQKMNQSKISGISVCLHPGVVRTQLSRYLSFNLQIALRLLKPFTYLFFKSSFEGAQTTLYTVLEDEDKLVPGQYYVDCKVGQSTQIAKNLQDAHKLWKKSQDELGIKFDI